MTSNNSIDNSDLFVLVKLNKKGGGLSSLHQNADSKTPKRRVLELNPDNGDNNQSVEASEAIVEDTIDIVRHVRGALDIVQREGLSLVRRPRGGDVAIDKQKIELRDMSTDDKLKIIEETAKEIKDENVITVTEVTKVEEEYKELSRIPGFSLVDLLTINRMIKEDIKPIVQEVIEKPFMIIDLVKHGLLPIYNEDFTFETRVLIGTSVHALHEQDVHFLETQYHKMSDNGSKRDTKYDKEDKALQESTIVPYSLLKTKLKRFPPNHAINIIGFLVPVNFFRWEILDKIQNRINSVKYAKSPIEKLSTCISNPSLHVHNVARLTLRPPAKMTTKYHINDIESLYHNIKWAADYYKQQFPTAEAQEILNNILERSTPLELKKKETKPLPPQQIPLNIINFMKENNLIAFETPFLDAVFCELYNVSLLDLYIYKYILGVELDISKKQRYEYLAPSVNKDLLLLRQYEYVYRLLYGVQTYNRLMAVNPNIQTSVQFLNLLTDVEKEEVLTEYERQMAFWKSFLDNRCEHKSALYSFYRAVSIEDLARDYKALKQFIDHVPSAKELSYAKCKSCKFDLICPHRLATAEYMTQGFSLTRKVNDLNIELSAFADNDINDPRYYFCIICGEKLFERDEWMGAKMDVAIPYEERRTLWFEAGMIINRFVTFSIAIDVQNTIDLMVKFCYPILLDYMQKLYIDSTNELEFSLLIKITFAAYFDKMMKSSNRMITFDIAQFEKTLSIRERDRFQKLFREIGERITNQKIEDRELFVYTFNTEERVEDLVLKDPIFMSFFRIIHKEAPLYLDESFINSLMALSHLYDILRTADVKPLDADPIIDNFDTELLLDNKYADSINNVRLFLELLEYNKFISYVKNIPKWNKIYSIVPNLIHTRNPNDPSNTDPKIVELIETLQAFLNKFEHNIIRKPIWRPKVRTDYKFKYETTSLGRIYDELGVKHTWDSVVIDGKESKIVKKREYSQSMGKYTDQYASNTKTYLSKADKLDETKIKDALRSANLMSNVFNFFTNRCPEGGLHERKAASDKCNKCGVHESMAQDERKKYVIKYINTYNTELAKELVSDEYEGVEVNPLKLDEIAGTLDEKYNYDEATIKLVANKLGVEFNALRHLGALQGHLYDDIVKGHITPPLPKTIDSYRIYLLDSYVMMYLTYKSSKRLSENGEFKSYKNNKRLAMSTKNPKVIIYFAIMFICNDLINLLSKHPDNAKEIINRILRSDMLLCKNSLSIFELREKDDDIIAAVDEYPEHLDEENTASLSYDGFDFEGFDDADDQDYS